MHDFTDVVLCDECADLSFGFTPTGAYSVDGCDICHDGRAGHQLYTPGRVARVRVLPPVWPLGGLCADRIP